MNLTKTKQSKSLQISTWLLIGIIVFLPMLIPSQKFEIIQLVCLGLLIGVQYKVGIHNKFILGTFSFSYAALTGFWVIGP